MQKSEQESFFAGIATRLHNEGAMKTYACPLGKLRETWGSFVKMDHHKATPVKNTPGLIYHDGDEPYNFLTTSNVQYYRDFEITREDVDTKVASAMKAIRNYIHEDEFAQYLKFFTENLEMPSHKAALKKAFDNIDDQLKHNSYDSEIVSADGVRRLIDEGNCNDIRASAKSSTLTYEAANQPELMLSLAIYQAAHMTYLEQLKAAINADPAITDDEKENASAVIDGPFKQFRTSLIFATMVPLTLLARVEMKDTEGKDKDELMKESITQGWKTFFKSKVLTRTYMSDEIEPDKEGGAPVKMTCPAINRLKESMNSHAVEGVYDYVAKHRQQLKGLLDEVQKVTAKVVGNGEDKGWASFNLH